MMVVVVFSFQMFFTSISGHETTAALLAFCVLELGDHPDIVERLVTTSIGKEKPITHRGLCGWVFGLEQGLRYDGTFRST